MGKHQYDKEFIDKVRDELASLPPRLPDKLSMQGAIAEMHDVIVALLDRGYSFRDIVREMEKRDLLITVPTLRSYFSKAQKKAGTSTPAAAQIDGPPKKKRGRPPTKKPEAATPASRRRERQKPRQSPDSPR